MTYPVTQSHRTKPSKDSEETNEFKFDNLNKTPGEGKAKEEGQKTRVLNTGFRRRQKRPVLSHLSENKNNCFLATQTVTTVRKPKQT